MVESQVLHSQLVHRVCRTWVIVYIITAVLSRKVQKNIKIAKVFLRIWATVYYYDAQSR